MLSHNDCRWSDDITCAQLIEGPVELGPDPTAAGSYLVKDAFAANALHRVTYATGAGEQTKVERTWVIQRGLAIYRRSCSPTPVSLSSCRHAGSVFIRRIVQAVEHSIPVV